MTRQQLKVSKQPLALKPVEVASALGAKSSGWLKTGDGPWSGWVIRKDNEAELKVEEVSTGWQVTDDGGRNVASGRELITVLKKALA